MGVPMRTSIRIEAPVVAAALKKTGWLAFSVVFFSARASNQSVRPNIIVITKKVRSNVPMFAQVNFTTEKREIQSAIEVLLQSAHSTAIMVKVPADRSALAAIS